MSYELSTQMKTGGWNVTAIRARRLARQNVLGVVAFVILLVMVLAAVFAPYITPGSGPFTIDSRAVLLPPGGAHLLGTDEFGRDVYTRIVYGARISLWVGLLAVSISAGVGVPAGIISAYAGGWVDFVIQRVIDALFAFPTIILALTIVSVMGKGLIQVTFAIGIVSIPRLARVARASTLGVMAQPYFDATTCMGATMPRVIVKHILPNILSPVIVLATAGFGYAILSEASLSFLGVGTPAPLPSWGTMLSGAAQKYIRTAPHLAIFPGISITLAVFAFNLIGDSLRDIFDPRLREA